MLGRFFDRTERKRRKLLNTTPPGPLRDYLSHPLPSKSMAISKAPLLALDFETTGLDSENEHILSIGYAHINKLGIELAEAGHFIINTDKVLTSENVSIHKITDSERMQGISLAEGMQLLLEQLQGRVLLAHHARTEVSFIQQSCAKLYGVKPLLPVIDTIEIAAQRMQRKKQRIGKGQLRLFNLRHQYGLPSYTAHNALYDAISAAELFLAEVTRLPEGGKTPLKTLLRYQN